MQNDSCLEFGYYEVTQGYRKVPGNICTGGVDLSPHRYQCSARGWLASWFTFRGIFLLACIGAVFYYGWPLIEAVILLLPVPDPADVKEKAKEYKDKAIEMVKGKGKGKDAENQPLGYQTQFGMPSSMQDDSDDDDHEDVGKDASQQQKALDYDSDEKDPEAGELNDLISLDGGKSQQRKKVPKLKKPSK